MQSSFKTEIVHIGIVAGFHRRAVFSRETVIEPVRIFPVGSKPLTAERAGKSFIEFPVEGERGIYQTE